MNGMILRRNLADLQAELTAMNFRFNGFISGDYEVRFLQDDRLTVCVIRNLHKMDERYTGITVLNPKDKFDAATGRHKAFKKTMETATKEVFDNAPGLFQSPSAVNLGKWVGIDISTVGCSISYYDNPLPVSQLQQDYWKRYGAEEK